MRTAISVESFNGMSFAELCGVAKEVGYEGLEVSLSTLVGGRKKGITATNLGTFAAERLQDLRASADAQGLQIVALNSPCLRSELAPLDNASRRDTVAFLHEAGQICLKLGANRLVFGESPRSLRLHEQPPELSPNRSLTSACQTLSQAVPRLAEEGLCLCLAPLDPSQTNCVTNYREAFELLSGVSHPSFKLLLDAQHIGNETVSIENTVSRTEDWGHCHASALDGPASFENLPLDEVYRALAAQNYDGWTTVNCALGSDPRRAAEDCLTYISLCRDTLV